MSQFSFSDLDNTQKHFPNPLKEIQNSHTQFLQDNPQQNELHSSKVPSFNNLSSNNNNLSNINNNNNIININNNIQYHQGKVIDINQHSSENFHNFINGIISAKDWLTRQNFPNLYAQKNKSVENLDSHLSSNHHLNSINIINSNSQSICSKCQGCMVDKSQKSSHFNSVQSGHRVGFQSQRQGGYRMNGQLSEKFKMDSLSPNKRKKSTNGRNSIMKDIQKKFLEYQQLQLRKIKNTKYQEEAVQQQEQIQSQQRLDLERSSSKKKSTLIKIQDQANNNKQNNNNMNTWAHTQGKNPLNYSGPNFYGNSTSARNQNQNQKKLNFKNINKQSFQKLFWGGEDSVEKKQHQKEQLQKNINLRASPLKRRRILNQVQLRQPEQKSLNNLKQYNPPSSQSKKRFSYIHDDGQQQQLQQQLQKKLQLAQREQQEEDRSDLQDQDRSTSYNNFVNGGQGFNSSSNTNKSLSNNSNNVKKYLKKKNQYYKTMNFQQNKMRNQINQINLSNSLSNASQDIIEQYYSFKDASPHMTANQTLGSFSQLNINGQGNNVQSAQNIQEPQQQLVLNGNQKNAQQNKILYSLNNNQQQPLSSRRQKSQDDLRLVQQEQKLQNSGRKSVSIKINGNIVQKQMGQY